jgi:hypothetical protein
MRRLFKYVEWAEELYEKVISSEELDRIDSYFNDIDNEEKTYAHLKYELNLIKEELKKIDYNNISVKLRPLKKYYGEKDNEVRVVSYSEYIDKKIDLLKDFCKSLSKAHYSNDNEIVDECLNWIDELYNTNVSIEQYNFNRIHIGGIPIVFKGVGLGYKLYKATLRKLGYISSDNEEVEVSTYAKLIWNKIRKDEECFTVVQEQKVLTFYFSCEENKIRKILEDFFKDYTGTNYIIDKDLIIKYPKIFLGKLRKYV